MRTIATLLMISIATLAQAAEMTAPSAIEKVTVYPDGALVTRHVSLTVPRGETRVKLEGLPNDLDPASVRIEGSATAGLEIGTVSVLQPQAGSPVSQSQESETKLQQARDRLAMLEDDRKALEQKQAMIARFGKEVPFTFGEKPQARPLGEWRESFVMVGQEAQLVAKALREQALGIRDVSREIARLEQEMNRRPPGKIGVAVDVSSENSQRVDLRVSYLVRQAAWRPTYEARLETGQTDKPALTLTRRAVISQNSGEDWQNTTLTISTSRVALSGHLPALEPWIVSFREPIRMLRNRVEMLATESDTSEAYDMAAPKKLAGAAKPAIEKEAAETTSRFQMQWQIPGQMTVQSGEDEASLKLVSMKVTPELLARATPALSPLTYLEARFRIESDTPFLPGPVSLYRDGMFTGESQIVSDEANQSMTLGFGTDERIRVTRQMINRTEGSAGLMGGSKMESREFRITVNSMHPRPIKLQLEDAIPVAENTAIEVETLSPSPAPSSAGPQDRRGILTWNLDLAPKESKEIKYGWRVKWPGDKQINLNGMK